MDTEDSVDVVKDSREVWGESWVKMDGTVDVVDEELRDCIGVGCNGCVEIDDSVDIIERGGDVNCDVWVEMDGPVDVADKFIDEMDVSNEGWVRIVVFVKAVDFDVD